MMFDLWFWDGEFSSMSIPSFDNFWRHGQSIKPAILVLEIKDKELLEAAALGWIVVEREEVYQRDISGRIKEASIRLSYQRLTDKFSSASGEGRFSGGYSRHFNAVSLTSSSMSKGAVFLDLSGLDGQRIGTYLMNEIVQWAKQWPEAEVNSVELLASQAYGINKARRNRFYEKFGLVFDYTDEDHRAGCSQSMLVEALVTVDDWRKNIVEHRVLDYLVATLSAKELATSALEARERANKWLVAERNSAQARPLRWAMKHLYHRYSGELLAILFIMLMVGVVWSEVNS